MNDAFSYIMVMITLIIGLSLTELLAGAARLLRARSTAKPYWLHTVSVCGLFMALFSLWWEYWGLRAVGNWTLPSVMFMLSVPVILYFMSSLIFPDTIEGTDFRKYYYEFTGLFWGSAIVVTLLATLFRPIVFHSSITSTDDLASLIQLVIAIILVLVKRPIVHGILVPIFFIIVMLDQFFFRYFIDKF